MFCSGTPACTTIATVTQKTLGGGWIGVHFGGDSYDSYPRSLEVEVLDDADKAQVAEAVRNLALRLARDGICPFFGSDHMRFMLNSDVVSLWFGRQPDMLKLLQIAESFDSRMRR